MKIERIGDLKRRYYCANTFKIGQMADKQYCNQYISHSDLTCTNFEICIEQPLIIYSAYKVFFLV